MPGQSRVVCQERVLRGTLGNQAAYAWFQAGAAIRLLVMGWAVASREGRREQESPADENSHAPRDGHPARGCDQVELQAPIPARVRPAVPIPGPPGQPGAAGGLPQGATGQRGASISRTGPC
jgi:hypothetical protein